MKLSEKILKEYFPKVDDVMGNETIEVLPLTIIDMMEEYGASLKTSKKKKSNKEN